MWDKLNLVHSSLQNCDSDKKKENTVYADEHRATKQKLEE